MIYNCISLMALFLRIHDRSALPIYQQILRQIREAIAAGRLESGEKLPSHRQLAKELVVSPLTVKRAYDQLEQEGQVETRRGMGTFVAAMPTAEAQTTREERLRATIKDLVSEARASGLRTGALLELVRGECARFDGERRKRRTTQP